MKGVGEQKGKKGEVNKVENEGKTKIIIIIVKQRCTTTTREISLKVDANGWREIS